MNAVHVCVRVCMCSLVHREDMRVVVGPGSGGSGSSSRGSPVRRTTGYEYTKGCIVCSLGGWLGRWAVVQGNYPDAEAPPGPMAARVSLSRIDWTKTHACAGH